MKLYTSAIVASKYESDGSPTTSFSSRLIVATDDDDAETQAMETCKKSLPESEGYEGHQVQVARVKSNDILKHPSTNTFYVVPNLVKVLVVRQEGTHVDCIIDPTYQQDNVKE